MLANGNIGHCRVMAVKVGAVRHSVSDIYLQMRHAVVGRQAVVRDAVTQQIAGRSSSAGASCGVGTREVTCVVM